MPCRDDRQTDRQADQTNRQIDGKASRQTERQEDGKAGSQAYMKVGGRQTDRLSREYKGGKVSLYRCLPV
jgi:hypothetical protein